MKSYTRYVLCYLGLVTVLMFVAFQGRAYDDPFITYRYAENLRSGEGFVYNTGERVLSTTTPLYTLVLAVLGWVWRETPLLSNGISALSLSLGAFFLYLAGGRWAEPLAGTVGALLMPLAPLMISTFGAETCFYVMLILGAFAFYAMERPVIAMLLAAAATLTRADGVLVAVVLSLGLLVRYRRVPWVPMLAFALIVVPWYLFSWVYFGSPFPVTLSAKQHQGQMLISQRFAPGFVSLLKARVKDPWFWVQGSLIALGLGYTMVKARQWFLLFAWGALYFVSYTLLGVSRYFWYYAPLVPMSVAALGLGIAALSHWMTGLDAAPKLRNGALALCVLAVGWPQAKNVVWLKQNPDTRAGIYREVGTWLAQNVPSDASVGTLEVGIIGFYAQRRMVDFAGLIQPDVALKMDQKTTYADTAQWAVETYKPEYLVINPLGFPDLVESVTQRGCEEVRSFSDANYEGELTVYVCDSVG